MYCFTVLYVGSPRGFSLDWKDVSMVCSILDDLGEALLLCLFHFLEAAWVPWLEDPLLHLQSQQLSISLTLLHHYIALSEYLWKRFSAPLGMIIISNRCNETLVQGVTTSVSSAAVPGTSEDAPSVSFLLNYLSWVPRVPGVISCPAHYQNLILEKAPKKSALSVADSIYP